MLDFAAALERGRMSPTAAVDRSAVRLGRAPYYPRSRDVTLYVLRNSAHCQNFASTRTQLWDRIGLWADEQQGDSVRTSSD